jgi:SM-20-related protein
MNGPAREPVRPALLFSGQFLSTVEAAELVQALRASPDEAATAGRGGDYAVRADVRRTRRIKLDSRSARVVADRLDAWRERLTDHFGERLTARQEAQFLGYSPGDFFKPHQDCGAVATDPPFLLKRRVSVVILLNPGEYEGGLLTLHNVPAPGSRLPLPGRAGQLIGFPSWLIHEVTPVARGERYSIASWYESEDPLVG